MKNGKVLCLRCLRLCNGGKVISDSRWHSVHFVQASTMEIEIGNSSVRALKFQVSAGDYFFIVVVCLRYGYDYECSVYWKFQYWKIVLT